nr:MazG family protein [Motilibacter aurantiacus]
MRSPGGCPWDAEQTHRSLIQYLLEEAYEVVEAIEDDDRDALVEEVGDLLLQAVFHARLGEERADGPWSIDDAADGIVAKLIRRHPHVFGPAAGTGEVASSHTEKTWDAVKRAEKGRASAVDGVPLAQPALSLASKLIGRAERAGLDVPVGAVDSAEPDVGELLLSVVARARAEGVDAEGELRAAARRYADRVRAVEAAGAAGTGHPSGA